MKWSRDGGDVPGTASVLRFPSGIQVELVLCGPVEAEAVGLPDAPAEPSEGAPEPTKAANDGPGQPPQAGLSPFNARALVVWNMAGLSLFGGGRRPTLQDVLEEARAIVVALEIEEKADNITRVAEALGTSRRVVRGYLRRMGLYDWTRMKSDDEDADVHEEARLDG